MNSSLQCLLCKKLLLPFCLLCFFGLIFITVNAQEKPPKPFVVTVSLSQHLSFGTFIPIGTAGTVTVTYEGFRSKTGDIILPNIFSIVTPALFIVEAHPGTLITIVTPDSQLTGSNGGTIHLKLEAASTGSQFIVNSESTNVFIGGTLTIGSLAANPAGSYLGTFIVTFIQQ